MHIAVAAWSMDVKPETIRNYFRHCRIHTTDADVTPVPEEPLIDPEVIKDLEEQVQECRNPSFGLATKAKGLPGVRAKRKPGSHIRDSRECRRV
jgi:hypothetical protein